MAISAPTKSAQRTNATAVPPQLNAGRDHAKLEMLRATLTFTAAGFTTAAAGDLDIERLPAGKIRVYGNLSRIVCPQGTATADLDLGWGDYIALDGTTTTGDKDGFAASLDVGGAAIDEDLHGTGVANYHEFESLTGVPVVASFDTANSPASGTMIVELVYTQGI